MVAPSFFRLAVVLTAWLLPLVAAAATFQVNTEDDLTDGVCSFHCSLRDAVTEANATPDHDTITFENPNGSGTLRIDLATSLPPITSPLTIDGFDCLGCDATQANTNPPEDGFNSILSVAIEGSFVTTGPWNRYQSLIEANGTELHLIGLSVRNSPGTGVRYLNASGSVTDCFFGTDLSGMVAMGNAYDGLACDGCSFDIDGTSLLFSGNGEDGLDIFGAGLSGARIAGHLAGVAADGVTPLGNGGFGLNVSNGSVTAMNGLTLGGTTPD